MSTQQYNRNNYVTYPNSEHKNSVWKNISRKNPSIIQYLYD